MNLYESVKNNLKESVTLNNAVMDSYHHFMSDLGRTPSISEIIDDLKNYDINNLPDGVTIDDTEEDYRHTYAMIKDMLKGLDYINEGDNKKEYTKEDKKAFAESINMTPLTNKIRQVAGIPDLKVDYEIEEDSWNESYRILVETGSVKEACGLVAKVLDYKNMNICNFSSSIDVNDENELEAYIQIDLNLDGGHGGPLFYATYTTKGKWKFSRR